MLTIRRNVIVHSHACLCGQRMFEDNWKLALCTNTSLSNKHDCKCALQSALSSVFGKPTRHIHSTLCQEETPSRTSSFPLTGYLIKSLYSLTKKVTRLCHLLLIRKERGCWFHAAGHLWTPVRAAPLISLIHMCHIQ